MIDEEAKTNKEEAIIRKPLVANPFLLVDLLVFVGVLVFGKGTLFPINGNQASSEPNDIKFTSTSSQIHEVEVKSTEYTPNNLVLEAGTATIINFKTEAVG